MSASDKCAKDIDKHLSNLNVDEVLVTYFLDTNASPYVLRRFYNLMVSFIYRQALKYEMGMIPAETYDMVVLCKKIKDYALADEEPPIPHPTYEPGAGRPKEYISP